MNECSGSGVEREPDDHSEWLEGDTTIERRHREERECVCVWVADQHSRLERGEHS
jgi:hypothetical protein